MYVYVHTHIYIYIYTYVCVYIYIYESPQGSPPTLFSSSCGMHMHIIFRNDENPF